MFLLVSDFKVSSLNFWFNSLSSLFFCIFKLSRDSEICLFSSESLPIYIVIRSLRIEPSFSSIIFSALDIDFNRLWIWFSKSAKLLGISLLLFWRFISLLLFWRLFNMILNTFQCSFVIWKQFIVYIL